jgi:hypothetical protein
MRGWSDIEGALIAMDALDANWNELLHPRKRGKFVSKGGGGKSLAKKIGHGLVRGAATGLGALGGAGIGAIPGVGNVAGGLYAVKAASEDYPENNSDWPLIGGLAGMATGGTPVGAGIGALLGGREGRRWAKRHGYDAKRKAKDAAPRMTGTRPKMSGMSPKPRTGAPRMSAGAKPRMGGAKPRGTGTSGAKPKRSFSSFSHPRSGNKFVKQGPVRKTITSGLKAAKGIKKAATKKFNTARRTIASHISP